MRLPSYNELFPEQRDSFSFNEARHLLIVGPPGSGKTSVALHRCLYLANRGKRVGMITRNRLLQIEAERAFGNLLRPETSCLPIFSRMHSYVAERHSQQIGVWAPNLAPYVFDWEQIMHSYAEADITPDLDHLIIDEGQNLPPTFYRWAACYGARLLTVVADQDQSNAQETSTVREIYEQLRTPTSNPECKRLSDNHRNTPEIARLARYFHNAIPADERPLPAANALRPPSGETPVLRDIDDWSALATMVFNHFRATNRSIGIVVSTIGDAKALEGKLCRISEENPPVRVDVYTSNMPEGAARQISPSAPGITIVTDESVIGLEFETVFYQGLARSLPTSSSRDLRRLYMVCSRPRDTLVLVDGPTPLRSEQLADLPGENLLIREDSP